MSAVLKSRLLSIMRNELTSQEFHPTRYCEQQINMLVGHGIARMRLNNVIDQSSHIIRAEQNLKALIKYFSNYSRDVGTFPTLSNSAFNTALNTCPIFWPYRS